MDKRSVAPTIERSIPDYFCNTELTNFCILATGEENDKEEARKKEERRERDEAR